MVFLPVTPQPPLGETGFSQEIGNQLHRGLCRLGMAIAI